MSWIRSASTILYGLYLDPAEKTKEALDIAKELEDYVLREKNDGLLCQRVEVRYDFIR